MSNNSLIAFAVGAIFLLAVVVVIGSFIDRRHQREMLTMLVKSLYSRPHSEDTAVISEPESKSETPWPVVPKG